MFRKSQPNLSLSRYKPKFEADFDMGFPVPHVGIIVEILRVNIKLGRDHELFGGAILIFFSQKRLTSSAKAECEVVSS